MHLTIFPFLATSTHGCETETCADNKFKLILLACLSFVKTFRLALQIINIYQRICPNRKLVLKMYHAKKDKYSTSLCRFVRSVDPCIFLNGEHLHFWKEKRRNFLPNLLRSPSRTRYQVFGSR